MSPSWVCHYDENLLLTGSGWVGWTNKKYPLQIVFLLTSLQSLQSVSIAVFNKPDMGIMVSLTLTPRPDTERNTEESHFRFQRS